VAKEAVKPAEKEDVVEALGAVGAGELAEDADVAPADDSDLPD
jgi:hypothetical protein